MSSANLDGNTILAAILWSIALQKDSKCFSQTSISRFHFVISGFGMVSTLFRDVNPCMLYLWTMFPPEGPNLCAQPYLRVATRFSFRVCNGFGLLTPFLTAVGIDIENSLSCQTLHFFSQKRMQWWRSSRSLVNILHDLGVYLICRKNILMLFSLVCRLSLRYLHKSSSSSTDITVGSRGDT